MGGVDVSAKIRDAADRVWRGLEARDELYQLIREHKGDPELGPTAIAELTDYLYRPEHISRIASSSPPQRRKRRRRFVDPESATA
jgi:hypothetical protein